jgi:hypothetical protein
MKQIFSFIKTASWVLVFGLLLLGCQKINKPSLADYPKDSDPRFPLYPGGPLIFFAAFDGTTTDPLMNAVDSIRANFASDNPLTSIDGISGKAVKGVDGKAIKYSGTNDFNRSTSFTIAFWMKNPAQVGRTEFVFSLVDDKYGWHHSAIFLMFENQTNTKSTMKLGLMDQWFEFVNEKELQKPLFDGQWHHCAYVYDETTSKLSYYFDGVALTGLVPALTDAKKDGGPRGKLDLSTANQLVLGGWNKAVGIAGPGDDWIKSYSGGIDQFRMYRTVLTAAEIGALYSGKK